MGVAGLEKKEETERLIARWKERQGERQKEKERWREPDRCGKEKEREGGREGRQKQGRLVREAEK